ncbi:prolyl oligopeptidase family serine peptidase [candidate division GN15 bacterium]|nr:prolyl oligopeptidase family serine peptidase [candidate division GN15 bacterium]
MSRIASILVCAYVLVFATSIMAQDDATPEIGYQMPPEEIAEIIDAPWTPSVYLSPDREWMLLVGRPGLPSIEEIAQPELRLAGLRINPATNGPSRGWYANELTFKRVSDLEEFSVTGLPENPRIQSISWSPDSRKVAFAVTFADHIELWMTDTDSREARRVMDRPLNAVYGSPYDWVSDSETLIARTVPLERGDAPEGDGVPDGPVIQQNLGKVAPARTYQDLLENAHDEALFAYYATSQVVRTDLAGNVTDLGVPGLHAYVKPSPNGEYLLVETIHRPFSYTVPASRFPLRSVILDMQGDEIFEIADLPLADQIPIAFGSVRTGRRSIDWRDDAGATVHWVEAQDGGNAAAEAEARDKLFMLPAPFTGEPIELMTVPDVRYSGITWGSDNLAIVTGWWWQTRNIKSWIVTPGDPSTEARVLFDRSWEDRYSDPGSPVTTLSEYGTPVLLTANDGQTIFLKGSGASPEGDRPFLDEFDLSTMEATRLFRSEAPYYEYVVTMIDPSERIVLTRRESVTEPPNYFVRDLESDDLVQKTFFPHPTPQLADANKELIRYERDDGVKLTATLYTPPGHDPEEDGPLPVLMWAYPQEYKSADAAGQVTDSPYRFIRVAWYSPLVWLVRGYAVLDDPGMPIIGEGDEEPNDTYVKQLVASAQAAADEVTRRGVGDPDRLAIAGHSYGAFMTANLLAHSDIYRAGIARSGAYNRTLTPFGFQSEERTFWEAPDVYFTMSPFMQADDINEPILLIHGEADNNSGTYPLQSERFYGALKGLGATARLVMLPHESHGYRARESVMHVMWEMSEWMDRYVRDAQPMSVDQPEQAVPSN